MDDLLLEQESFTYTFSLRAKNSMPRVLQLLDCFSSDAVVPLVSNIFFGIQKSRIDCFALLNHCAHESFECPNRCLIRSNTHCWE